jgi:hypothetical protein
MGSPSISRPDGISFAEAPSVFAGNAGLIGHAHRDFDCRE